ncbi:hypothetical protein MANES_18G105616v8 [Manihot esculenta]|uniref:Uncharacterized protein n=1 Tax=Manihot esculenta TaxID=3983 RepID=A0ACB7FZN5_MANES|nr:hypothetical protein MANES_18G105616v8 [Manihot esculenta]
MSMLISAISLLSFLLLCSVTCSVGKKIHHCALSCGNLQNISYPFGIVGYPSNCGDPSYLFECENNKTVLRLFAGKYYVQEINRSNKTIRLVDADLQQGNCSSLPLSPFTNDNFIYYSYHSYQLPASSVKITYMKCENSVDSTLFVQTHPCVDGVYSNNKKHSYSYVVFGDLEFLEIPNLCRVDLAVTVSSIKCHDKNCSYLDVFKGLLNGFELSWSEMYCKECKSKFMKRGYCIFNDDYSKFLECSNHLLWNFIYGAFIHLPLILAIRCFCGIPCLATFFIIRWRRRHLSMYDEV